MPDEGEGVAGWLRGLFRSRTTEEKQPAEEDPAPAGTEGGDLPPPIPIPEPEEEPPPEEEAPEEPAPEEDEDRGHGRGQDKDKDKDGDEEPPTVEPPGETSGEVVVGGPTGPYVDADAIHEAFLDEQTADPTPIPEIAGHDPAGLVDADLDLGSPDDGPEPAGLGLGGPDTPTRFGRGRPDEADDPGDGAPDLTAPDESVVGSLEEDLAYQPTLEPVDEDEGLELHEDDPVSDSPDQGGGDTLDDGDDLPPDLID